MALANDHRHSPITRNTQDLLSFNPFAEEQAPAAAPVAHSYRAVSSALPSKRHIRSRTEAYTSRDASGGHLHPLRSAGLTNGLGDAGITRPHLSRIVKVGTLVDVPPIQSDNASNISSFSVKEQDVLVHEVDTKDSLAGVSLKYGISMADLRRANHLWASDSIHFRKVLYIPLEKAARTSQIQTDYNLLSITPSEESPNPMDLVHDIAAHDVDEESLSNERPLGTIRRIPTSHLSFFPPPSTKDSINLSQSTQSSPYVRASPAPIRPSFHTHNRFGSSPSLTSILTALPIAASTRDTIIARLSFDSISSSYSDGEDAEQHHGGLELDDVRRVRPSNSVPDERVARGGESQYIQPPVSQPTSHHVLKMASVSAPSQRNVSDGDYVHPPVTPKVSKSSTSPPRPSAAWHSGQRGNLSDSPKAYIPSHPQIRTAQLEPSPEMQLPLLKTSISQSKGKRPIRTRLLDMDFELEGTQNSVSSRS